MFDLNREIQNWCLEAAKKGPHKNANITELMDHLHCDVESLITQGLTPEQAFTQATAQLGDHQELANEYAKNRSLLRQCLYQLEGAGAVEDPRAAAKQAAAIIGVSLFFAAAIIVTDILLADTGYAQTATFLLIAIWWIPFSLLAVPRQQLRKEFACVKQRLTRWRRQ